MHIEQVEGRHLDQLTEFFLKVMGKADYISARRDFFSWQYERSAEVAKSVEDTGAILLVEDGQIHGASLAAKTEMWVAGCRLPGAWNQEWFVDDEARGLGLLLLKEQLKRNRFFGASGQSISAGNIIEQLRPMCWFELARLFVVVNPKATFDLLFSCEPEARSFLRWKVKKPPKDVRCEQVAEFDEEYEEHWSVTRNLYTITTNRNKDYMNWRYVNHPYFRYETIKCETGHGCVYFVWRLEPIEGNSVQVARICEVIGIPLAVTEAFPAFYHKLVQSEIAFADFFCSNSQLNAALLTSGMKYSITLPEFDLPRLFSPVATDIRRTINFAYSIDRNPADLEFYRHDLSYFTKGDTNQDRPNF